MSELLDLPTAFSAVWTRQMYSSAKGTCTAVTGIAMAPWLNGEGDTDSLPWPSRDKFMAIYTTDQIKQLQIDTQWPGTVDLYEHIKNYVRERYAQCKD